MIGRMSGRAIVVVGKCPFRKVFVGEVSFRESIRRETVLRESVSLGSVHGKVPVEELSENQFIN